jgi:hypothetical protein
MSFGHRELADRDARPGAEVHLAISLNHPPAGGELPVDVDPCLGLGPEVVARSVSHRWGA